MKKRQNENVITIEEELRMNMKLSELRRLRSLLNYMVANNRSGFILISLGHVSISMREVKKGNNIKDTIYHIEVMDKWLFNTSVVRDISFGKLYRIVSDAIVFINNIREWR